MRGSLVGGDLEVRASVDRTGCWTAFGTGSCWGLWMCDERRPG